MKKMLSLLLALVMCLTLCVPAFATEVDSRNESSVNAIENVFTEDIITTETNDAIVYTHILRNTQTGDIITVVDTVYEANRLVETYENGIFTDSASYEYTPIETLPHPMASPGFQDIDEMYMSSVGLWGTLYRYQYPAYERSEYVLDFSSGTKIAFISSLILSFLLPGCAVLSVLSVFGTTVTGVIIDCAVKGKTLHEYVEIEFEVWATNATTNKLGLRTSRTNVYQVVTGINGRTNKSFRESVYSRTDGDTRTNSAMMTDGILNVASGAMG